MTNNNKNTPSVITQPPSTLHMFAQAFNGMEDVKVGLNGRKLRVIKAAATPFHKRGALFTNEIEMTLHKNTMVCVFYKRNVSAMNVHDSGILPGSCTSLTVKMGSSEKDFAAAKEMLMDRMEYHLNGTRSHIRSFGALWDRLAA